MVTHKLKILSNLIMETNSKMNEIGYASFYRDCVKTYIICPKPLKGLLQLLDSKKVPFRGFRGR
jgi:hypothetical protein